MDKELIDEMDKLEQDIVNSFVLSPELLNQIKPSNIAAIEAQEARYRKVIKKKIEEMQ